MITFKLTCSCLLIAITCQKFTNYEILKKGFPHKQKFCVIHFHFPCFIFCVSSSENVFFTMVFCINVNALLLDLYSRMICISIFISRIQNFGHTGPCQN